MTDAAKKATASPSGRVNIKTLQVDDEVNCWCGKCKGFRAHKVKTLQPPKPPKSVCLTCRAVHQVRLQEPGTKKSRSDRKEMPDVPPWPELVAGVDPDTASSYHIMGNFEIGELVMHKSFGLGCVIAVPTEQRAQMSFESGVKWLLQNHAGR